MARVEGIIPQRPVPTPERMKAIVSIVLGLLLSALLPLQAQNPPQARYQQGLALFNQGKYEEALAVFEEVLQARPDFVYARNYAQKCKLALAEKVGPQNDLAKRLEALILPEIAVADAPLGDVLDYLASRAQELSEGKTVLNFIFQGSPEQRRTPVTLSLRNVPMSEAIKYVGQLSRSVIKYEPHAIVVTPAAALLPEENASKAP
jgi:tetratricopeptide (TPR) repeat protein